jgi:hypothetical protein
MTPEQLSPEAFAALGGQDIVYVRPVKGAELLADTPIEMFKGFHIKPNQVLYALHGADGERLAVTMDKASALAAAHEHEMDVVSLH